MGKRRRNKTKRKGRKKRGGSDVSEAQAKEFMPKRPMVDQDSGSLQQTLAAANTKQIAINKNQVAATKALAQGGGAKDVVVSQFSGQPSGGKASSNTNIKALTKLTMQSKSNATADTPPPIPKSRFGGGARSSYALTDTSWHRVPGGYINYSLPVGAVGGPGKLRKNPWDFVRKTSRGRLYKHIITGEERDTGDYKAAKTITLGGRRRRRSRRRRRKSRKRRKTRRKRKFRKR